MLEIINSLAKELQIKPFKIEATLKLLDDGNTIPFIARYRKEATGELDEEQIRTIEERASYLRNLTERKSEIIASITAQDKLTPELEIAINNATKLQEIEDLYLPYRPKKRTRAQIARERGLSPLAETIIAQNPTQEQLKTLATMYLNEEKEIQTIDDALNGASDIIAETIADSADIRELIRRNLWQNGLITTELINDQQEAKDFLMYSDYSEAIRQLPSHRILAINRGENKKFLKVNLTIATENILAKLERKLQGTHAHPLSEFYLSAIADSYKRLLFPSLEREIRSELTDKAEKQAITVFAQNLRQLLLTQPLTGHIVLGLDPGYRTGCKAAVIGKQGQVLATDALYLTGSEYQRSQAELKFLDLVQTHQVTLISIGNGTASYETEEFTAQMIEKHNLDIAYIITNEAGASVYSASKLAREEMPDLDVSLRGAVSIARRVQDPLAELVKIESKAIGVGQYQHDVNQKNLTQTLSTVVESCVNHVGVELNTASSALLSYVSGISASVANNVIAWRNTNKVFTSRKELLKVPRLGPAAFTQCAGFLRIKDANNPLDNTGIHPESYKLTEALLKELGFTLQDFKTQENDIKEAVLASNAKELASKLDAGEPTVIDIMNALANPGRDPRTDAPPPLTRQKLTKLSDLKIGSIMRGKVQNVVDFGAFVDIGLKTSGFIHRSELSKKHFKHPLDVIAVGEIVDATVISIDEERNRIGLSLKQ
ncbi:MAG TPA: RNA-binding transcriptional accessory protein [Candidatus Avacidaminococcus intestinavium]|uniref:RNA-binding transcriptional accessory protein n=1 Tax=Candidatus Avacidaminococcus intestinavium TaxID=2840684 RepID=A0A9D1MQ64_9FIRM|nr:RNA-binding transcriptional accessory protein [Candidatus Avacidaminococcus intestinavium]